MAEERVAFTADLEAQRRGFDEIRTSERAERAELNTELEGLRCVWCGE